jgi:hypothetical protein
MAKVGGEDSAQYFLTTPLIAEKRKWRESILHQKQLPGLDRWS